MTDLRIDVTANVQGAVAGLEQVRKSTQRTGSAITSATTNMWQINGQVTTAQKNFRKFAMGGMQQAGYQIGDYAVQVANGTSKMQAFGQQAPQLLQIFGPIGAIVGAGVAVFAAFGVALQRSSAASKVATREFMSLNDVSLSSIRGSASDLVGIQTAYNEALAASGGASTSSSRLVLANSEIEFNARKQLVGIERELLRLRSQDQVSALKNLKDQQDRTRASAIELARNIGPNATDGAARGASGYANAAYDVRSLDTALGGTLTQMRTNRRAILQLEAELSQLGIASSEAEAAMEMVFNPNGDVPQAATEIATAINGASVSGTNLAEIINTEVTPAMERLKAVQGSVSSAIESGMMSMVDGTQSVKEAFKSMASAIIKDLYRIFVVKKITGFISDAIGAKFGPAVPATPALAGVRAMGGQVTGGKAYMVGERGPEVVVPSRNSHVVPNNQTGGGSGVTIIQNNTFGNGVNRAEINAMLPKIVEASKAAVLDARRRGGSYAGAF